ncbi:MAG TPA: hypothetical protein VNK24_11320 [Elusimicrobiota bacterium]|nr:hypothetical protein [Elusimicrobiota bacterium]
MVKKFVAAIFTAFVIGAALAAHWLGARYAAKSVMSVPVREYSTFTYPEDPAVHSARFGWYDGRRLKLSTRDGLHFDFVFEPDHPGTARVKFKDVDMALMQPRLPAWVKSDPALERIALTDREWNRQQVSFEPRGPHVEIEGGDGWERAHIYSADLARNCLNAGLWEILLYSKEKGRKTLYYHGWFTFPLGWYARIFERENGLRYWRHWYYLEHWDNPAGLKMDLAKLRRVVREIPVRAAFNPDGPILVEGEQICKRKNMTPEKLATWGDFIRESSRVRFAAFLPPGRYYVSHPWGNEYWRLARFLGADLREIQSPAMEEPMNEVVLKFQDTKGNDSRFIISGFSLRRLPRLKPQDYPKGLYMPMGIGVPPFHQSYEDLENNPPDKSPYFCVWLDAKNRWINHHEGGIDGPVLFVDKNNPKLLHVYLLSYERHSLIAHYRIYLPSNAEAL